MTTAFPGLRAIGLTTALVALSACQGGTNMMSDLDWDFRGGSNTLDTTEAARQATAAPPRPDANGVISYPGYQVAVARQGDTVATVAAHASRIAASAWVGARAGAGVIGEAVAGATQVHFLISSPPITHPDYYGIDTPQKDKLLAATHSLEEMRAYIGSDSLAFLSVDGIYRSMGYADRDMYAHKAAGK